MANSYAAVADVEAYTQDTPYSTTTFPKLVQVQGFLDNRAGQLYGWLVEVMGDDAVGPVSGSNYANEIVTSTDRGFALNRLLLQANAMWAAADALQAAGASESPARTARVNELLEDVEGMKDEVQAMAVLYATGDGDADDLNRSATHISTGEVTEGTIYPTEQQGYAFTSYTKW